MKFLSVIFSILLIFSFQTALWAQELTPPPEINAASAILIETGTGTILYEKNADVVIPPASMTKLMTIHIVLNFIKNNGISTDTLIPISVNADFRNAPAHSSLMFIEEGQKVSIMELLKGLALPSGNDAGIAVAEFVTGSIPEFVELMNLEVGKLGLSSTHFADSSGYSENNRTTAREYAAFCTFYLREHPETIEQLHSLESFTYPEDHNLSEGGNSVHGPITQGNHNVLIGRLKNIDGLKTGYIDESGYNLAASAEFDGRRFILVTMGGPGRNTQDGLLRRAIDGTALFNYGFYGWTTLSPEVPETGLLKILGGEKNELDITYSPAENITIQSAEAASLVCIEKWNEIIYPVEKGAIIGSWQLSGSGGKVYQSGVITADERLNKGNIFKRFLDRFRSAE